MTKYFGIGAYYKRRKKDLSKIFYMKRIVCISSTIPYTKQREEFRDIFWNIKPEDIMYMKAYIIQRKTIRVKAVGKVFSTENNKKNTKFGHCIGVNWCTTYDAKGLIDIPINDDGVPRHTRIYQERNPNIIQIIDELIKKYKKD